MTRYFKQSAGDYLRLHQKETPVIARQRLFYEIKSKVDLYLATTYGETHNFQVSYYFLRYYYTVTYGEGDSKVAFRVFVQERTSHNTERHADIVRFISQLDEYTELVDEFFQDRILIFTCKIPHRPMMVDKSDLDAELDITFI